MNFFKCKQDLEFRFLSYHLQYKVLVNQQKEHLCDKFSIFIHISISQDREDMKRTNSDTKHIQYI